MKLFEPGRIGKMSLKNRIVMCPMGVGGLTDPDGGFSSRARDYYVARAKGGTGLIITSATLVTTAIEGEALKSLISVLDSFDKKSRLSELAEEVHHYGAKLCIQLSPGVGRVSAPPFGAKPPVSASAVPAFWLPDTSCRELTKEEIKMLVEAYGNSAALARDSGVDAIEIHGYGGYLVDQFMTALWNKRADEYGGDLDGRMRFPMELIQSVKDSCGKDFPIIFKFTPKHYIEGGRELDEGLEIARRLEEAGVSALHVDMGCYESWYTTIPPVYQPPACQIELAEAVKKVVKIPVIAHGKLGYPEVAEAVLRDGKADFIGLGRPLLADPEWANKVKEGRVDDIVPCIGCHDGCLSRIFTGKHISCAVNPTCGKEREYELSPAPEPKSVLVIGGGPGGLEAAIVAARRGHKVALWERGPQLGGNLLPAMQPDFKRDIRRLVEYLTAQVRKLGVSVQLMKEATPNNVLDANPDVVIIATGSDPIVPDLPGIERGNVSTAVEVLLGRKKVGDRVVVAGGGFVGCETAVFLARQGKKVTIIEMLDRLMPPTEQPVFAINEMMLRKMIEESGIKVLTNTKLLEVQEGRVVVESQGTKKQIECDSLVLALGLRPRNRLEKALDGRVKQVFTIGDAAEPRRIINAIWEGFHAARII